MFETNETDSSSVSLRLPPDVCIANSLDNGVILFSPQEKAFLICRKQRKAPHEAGREIISIFQAVLSFLVLDVLFLRHRFG